MRRVPIPTVLSLKKAIIFSAVVHLMFFITISAAPGLRLPFMEKPLKIDVMWVELPRGTSEDIGLGLKQAEGLPKSTIEEQKKIFQPEKPAQQTLAPEMKAPPPTPVKEEPKVKPSPRPEVPPTRMTVEQKGAKPKAAPKVDRKIADALAKIDKQLTGRQIVPESGQVGSQSDGYKYGTSNKPLRVSPSDPEYLKYQAMVRAKIIREWVIPGSYGAESGGHFNARLEVMVNTDGEVTSTRWSKSSGNPSFDQSAVRAVRKASPFPKPPDRLAWEAYNEGFLIEFDPRMKPY